jgi:hypothetical protein
MEARRERKTTVPGAKGSRGGRPPDEAGTEDALDRFERFVLIHERLELPRLAGVRKHGLVNGVLRAERVRNRQIC